MLKYMTSVFLEKYDVGCCAALHHNKSKTNLHIHLIFSEKDSPYLATKKIGKNNPKEAEIKADNYLRQEWNRNVDRALLTGASEAEVMAAKQLQIDVPVAESLREHGQDPRLFTGILQKAIGYLRGFVEFLRETKYCDRDLKGNPLIDHDVRIDITPERIFVEY